ncbi:MAG: biopolymer transporter ExbD [Chitinophagaceae bacterium]|nr:biopolymer transporter ExbD [Chitinophagaceae bacterium]MBK7678788.1 biopolymer transporter ExbD [Chitinophagaceae bacterium]MBK8299866.1 biopolymer transporter ExbD [Chitinophagaceae bacterium]MBK9658968.1 biopolymer transporter ExbD [Chitinophagaceae bacterium]MBP6231648.1 biopolymer transporter ExbD [Chitinophagaceae bacterium]
MPSVKLPRKSTDTDMTPFVDIAFLILSFFIMATKFKPPEPVEITTPGSVLSQKLPESNAVMIVVDSANRVFFSVLSDKDPSKFDAIIQDINSSQNLNLSTTEMANYRQTFAVGVPFGNLKELLAMAPKEQQVLKVPGIPVLDTANNQLFWWILAAKKAFAGEKLNYLIKGDAKSKYPTFEAVVSALKRNDEFKYNLVTALDDIPSNSELDLYNRKNLKE